jgi:2-phospho-L-lactate guanylyltransferase
MTNRKLLQRGSSEPGAVTAAIVVPVRSFATGKSRLAAALGDGERRALVRSMAEQAVRSATGVSDRVRVLTPDAEVTAWAEALGVTVRPDHGGGLNAALEAARAAELAEGATSVAVLFADLPQVSEDDVTALLDLPAAGVVIAPDTAGTGTNALHVAATATLAYRFGAGSFALHLAQEPAATVLRRRGLAFDVDDPSAL